VQNGTNNKRNLGENRTGNFTAVGLTPKTEYTVEIIAKDPAGNEVSKTTTASTTDGSGSGGNQGGNSGSNGSGSGTTDPNGSGGDNTNQGGNQNGSGGNNNNGNTNQDQNNKIDLGENDGYEDTGTLQRPTIRNKTTRGMRTICKQILHRRNRSNNTRRSSIKHKHSRNIIL